MLSLLLFVLVVSLLIRQRSVIQRVERLERRLFGAEAGAAPDLATPPRRAAAESQEPIAEVEEDNVPEAVRPWTPPPVPHAQDLPPRQAADPGPAPHPLRAPQEEWAPPAWWVRLQRQLIENWTGILGAGILVAGITFVAGYTGLRMSPFNRSLMVAGSGVALLLGAQVARRRYGWATLAQWLSSAGAAVILFACFGSSALPWLAWTDGLAQGFAVLMVGIAINLLVAHRAGTESVVALHVVLALIPLWLVPQSGMTLGVATVVAAAGLAMGWRSNWDLSTLSTLLTYAVFHVAWAGGEPGTDPTTVLFRAGGTGSAALVAALVGLGHYRSGRSEEPARAIPLALHILNWGLLAGAIAFYLGATPLRGVLLLVTAAGAYGMAILARSRGIHWVYLTDVLAAETLLMAAFIAFDPWVYHWLVIPAAIFGLALASHFLAMRTGERFLERVGMPFVHVSGVVLFYAGLLALDTGGELAFQHAGTLLTAAGFAIAYHLHLVSKAGEEADSIDRYVRGATGPVAGISLLGVGVGFLIAAALFHLSSIPWGVAGGAGAAVLVMGLARGGKSASLAVGGWIALLVAYLRGLADVTDLVSPSVPAQLATYVPLAATGVIAVALLPQGRVTGGFARVTVFMVGGLLALATFTILEPFHHAYPPMAWGALSLLALVIAGRVPKARDAIVGAGFATMAVMWLALVLLILDPGVPGGPDALTRLSEGAVLVTLLICWRYPAGEALAGEPIWRFSTLALDLALLALSAILVAQGSPEWRPLAWGLLANGLVATGRVESLDDRLRFYGVAVFWIALIDFAVVGEAGMMGLPVVLLTLGTQVAFLVWASPRLELGSVSAPRELSRVADLAAAVGTRLPAFLYYPFFAALAVFLYWRFDAALLTLLWAGEAFLVFAVSLALREGHFRYMALAALAAVVGRLILFDMAESNLGLRGVVFIGVGLLMLGMNTLYNRYKDRYV